MFKLKKVFLSLVLLPLVLSGCTLGVSPAKNNQVAATFKGGMWRSPDLASNWEQIVNIYSTGGQQLNFNSANITTLAKDPSDKAAIYVGTDLYGIFYSYDYGQAWLNTVPAKGTINDIAIDPKDKCTIYTAIFNSIYKSIDCSRTWQQIYFENRPNIYITSLNINYAEPNIIYAGNSDGWLMKSKDHGFSWDVINRFGNPIRKIFIQNHLDSKIMYVVTATGGIFRSADGGADPSTWVNLLNEKVAQADVAETDLKPFNQLSGAASLLAINIDYSVPDGLIYANSIGIFRLTYGDMWKEVPLLPPQRKESVKALVVNPKNTNEIFYGTVGAFYHSIDNGANWNVTKVPNSGWPSLLMFSDDAKYLYYGSYAATKK